MSRRYVEVALPPPLPRELIYAIPPDLPAAVRPGTVVLVPLQKQLVTGFVLGDAELPAPLRPGSVRNIAQVLDADSPLTTEIVELCRWMAAYYLAPIGGALAAALPPGVKLSTQRSVQLADGHAVDPDGDSLAARVCAQLRADGALKVTTLRRRLGRTGLEQTLQQMSRAGYIDISPVLQDAEVSIRREQRVRAIDADIAAATLPELSRRAPRQARCLEYVLSHGSPAKKTLVSNGFGYGILRGLGSRGLIETVEEEIIRDPLAHLDTSREEAHAPSDDQRRALEPVLAALDKRVYFPALLMGVTGSGKTLVYLKAVERTLAQGRSAIVLVPEIALAWQMVRRFKARFGSQVAVLHSQLSKGERYDTWRRLRRGEQRLVIGARSAVLAPMAELGLIVVDEEHDGAYNQDDLENRHALAYSARDVALVRARRADAVVLLGSATPSLETSVNARSGKYGTLVLPRRVDDRPLPRVEVVDMRREPFQRRRPALFSKLLRVKIRDRLDRGERIILLQNRRGFAPVVQCRACGEAVECRRCRVCLTLHRSGGEELRCHYCDYRIRVPSACPDCGSDEVGQLGFGTQQVESSLLEQFPGIRVIRMDVDTTGWKGAHDLLVERFRSGDADVLLGTQMVAKGLDFPEVTLVGVISADTGLHMPDFRAAERSFQLLTQVAGRSGRGSRPGEVVIQTLLPEERAVLAAAAQDYEAFAEFELEGRREAGFPPFGRLLVLRWRGDVLEKVEMAAHRGTSLLTRTRPAGEGAVLGPAPAPLALLRGRHRWQALLLGPSAQVLRNWVSLVVDPMREFATSLGVDLTLVVDPQNTM